MWNDGTQGKVLQVKIKRNALTDLRERKIELIGSDILDVDAKRREAKVLPIFLIWTTGWTVLPFSKSVGRNDLGERWGWRQIHNVNRGKGTLSCSLSCSQCLAGFLFHRSILSYWIDSHSFNKFFDCWMKYKDFYGSAI